MPPSSRGPLNILVLCYEHPPVGGGGGRIATQIAQKLAARGHSVRFLTGNLSPPRTLPKHENLNGIQILRVPAPRRLPDTCTVPEMAAYLLWALPHALREIKRAKPDVIHAHFAVPTGALAYTLHRLTGLPYALTAHLGDVPGGVPEQTDSLFRWVMPFTRPIWHRAAKATAVSSFVAGLAQKAYGIRPAVIPNGIPTLPPEPDWSAGAGEILFAGRLSIQKNPLLALEALALIQDVRWRFHIVGDGPLRQACEAFATHAGILAQVHFHGWLDSSALAALRRRCSLLFIPSLSEGLPMVAVEALADGMAIVGTDIPGLHDVVEPGRNGLLCPRTPQAMASALRKLLTNPKKLLAFRQASRAKARNFLLEDIVVQYDNILTQAAASQAPLPIRNV